MTIFIPRMIDKRIAELHGWTVKPVGKNRDLKPIHHIWNPQGKQIGYWYGLNSPEFTYNFVELEAMGECIPATFPHYSTDLNAAIALLESEGLHWQLHGGGNPVMRHVRVYGDKPHNGYIPDVTMHGAHPLAELICLAYLKYRAIVDEPESEAS